jgi:SAM-dependent methyltransferase
VNSVKSRLANSAVISFDSYDESVYLDRDINDWSADSNDDNEWHLEPIATDIDRLLHEPLDYIILDYPFGYGNKLVGQYINLTVYVDTPLDVALARRIIRDYTNRASTRHKIEVNLSAIENELRHYLARSRPTYLRMIEKQKPASDLIVDGTKEPDAIADEILDYLTTRAHYDLLIDENNDPVYDTQPLREYMDKWDGQPFIDSLQLSPDKSVLEIGVGTGRLAVQVADKCKIFAGMDISPKTFERAKENLSSYHNVNLILGDFLSYPFDRTFDVIYTSLTFMHIKDKRAAIGKIANLLNTGGLFVLSISKSQDKILECGDRKINLYPDTPEQIASLLNNVDLAIEKQFETEFATILAIRKGSRLRKT